MSKTKILDKWEQLLAEKKKELQKCQSDHALKSCLGCDKLLNCSLRNSYVNAVYSSMNKGHGGGFEF